ncbi:MAG: SGNH/GDSL hydrolase family protein [Clostridia bacterium]|nr:SGNH/GDSL hydrolase family protein [Clostridia bacterium]
MKKLLCFILTILMSVGTFTVAFAQEEIKDPFEGQEEVVVVAFGGSLTMGAGGNYADDWTHGIVDKLLPSLYGDNHKYILANMAIGGTHSQYGMYRFESDVEMFEPDVVIIEFCVNDQTMVVDGKGVYQPEEGKRNMESIIRQCMELPKKPYVMLLGLGTSKDTSVQCQTYKELASYYGIGFIDINNWMQTELCVPGGELDYCTECVDKSQEERMECIYHEYHDACKACKDYKVIPKEDVSGMSKEEQIEKKYITARQFCDKIDSTHRDYRHTTYYNVSSDGVHPNKNGYMLWADKINEIIASDPDKYFAKPDESKPRLYTYETEPQGFVNPTIKDFSEIEKSDSWKEGEEPFIIKKGFPEFVGFPSGREYKTYISETVGDKISFKFYGSTLYMMGYSGEMWGKFKVTVDGDTLNSKVFNQYNEKNKGYGSRANFSYSTSLSNDWHTAVIENVGGDVNTSMCTPIFITDAKEAVFNESTIVFKDSESFKNITVKQNEKELTFSFEGDEAVSAMLVLKNADGITEKVLYADGEAFAKSEEMVFNNGDMLKVYFWADGEMVYATEEIIVAGI